MIFVFFLGLLAARWVVNLKSEGLKMVLDGLLTLPLVLPEAIGRCRLEPVPVSELPDWFRDGGLL